MRWDERDMAAHEGERVSARIRSIRATQTARGDPPPDELALMRAARDNPARFAPLYTCYAPRVYAYCLRRTGSPQEAEDLTSQIFTRAIKGLHTYQGGYVAAWLFSIARTTVADHYRRGRDPSVPLETVEQDLTDEAGALIDHVLHCEQRDRLRALVALLPPEDQELLALRIHGDLSAAQIGRMVGKTAGAVRTRLHRILKRLRALCPEDLREGLA
jgi:RNA polymerase sigma-70 factor (ECF subfamily)